VITVTWGGYVFDVDAIIETLEADWQVLAGDRRTDVAQAVRVRYRVGGL